eukprot:4830010-Amphidinium_carterae.1
MTTLSQHSTLTLCERSSKQVYQLHQNPVTIRIVFTYTHRSLEGGLNPAPHYDDSGQWFNSR